MDREDVGTSDGALVAAVGDKRYDALREIYRRHGGAVWSVAVRVSGDADRAKEVCTAVFADLWSHPQLFDPAAGALRSWLVAGALTHLGGSTSDDSAPVLGTLDGSVKSRIRSGLLSRRRALEVEGVTT